MAGSRRSVTKVRLFRRADLKRVLEIEDYCFGAAAYTREMFFDLNHKCGPLFFVAERRAAVVGYIVSCVSRRKAEVISIAVDPAWQERGVGSALMANTLGALRGLGVHEVWLMVRSGSTAAIRFYRGFGYRRVGRVARYYEDGGDALRMRLLLDAAK